ncbi:MAG: ATP phosphoribosyltransferase regulatory subunit, partial [Candidatus Omnitrophota bacterium]
RITEHLCVDCITHFQAVQEALTSVNISYVIDPLLVRGLDYYSKTVFEVSCPGLGSQDAVAAGGRYNRLIEDLGGTPTPACGFALGVERVLMAAKDAGVPEEGSIDIFFVLLGDGAKKTAFAAITALRDRGMVCQMEADGKSLKSQMRLADRLKARHVVIIGDDELARSIAVVRNMNTRAQSEIALKDLPSADFVRM